VFQGGSGNDYMQTSAGAATFDLSPGDVDNDIIAGFRIGTDIMTVAGEAPASVALAALIAGATQDTGGNAVLHLSGSHQVPLQGVAVAQVTGAIFS
jgi:hypothetical protein